MLLHIHAPARVQLSDQAAQSGAMPRLHYHSNTAFCPRAWRSWTGIGNGNCASVPLQEAFTSKFRFSSPSVGERKWKRATRGQRMFAVRGQFGVFCGLALPVLLSFVCSTATHQHMRKSAFKQKQRQHLHSLYSRPVIHADYFFLNWLWDGFRSRRFAGMWGQRHFCPNPASSQHAPSCERERCARARPQSQVPWLNAVWTRLEVLIKHLSQVQFASQSCKKQNKTKHSRQLCCILSHSLSCQINKRESCAAVP